MKKFLLLGILAALMPSLASAATVTAGPNWSVQADGSVSIRWTTDVATGSRVQFGPDVKRLDQRADGEVGEKHVVTLKNVKPGTVYFYTVGTARQSLATNSFTMPGEAAAASAPVKTTKPETAKTSSATPAATPQKAPPTRQTWGNMGSLQDHFDRHGGDFKAKDPDDYARMAWEFLQRAKRGEVLVKVDEEGVMRVFDPKSRAFASYNRDGTTKTYFRPNSPDYFERQPGKLVKLNYSK
jgi:hypothetical protein